MTNTLIISAEYVKANSILDENIENDKLISSIRKAQDLHIWSMLGSNLYNKILTDIANNTLSGNYKILVDEYILPILLEYSVYYALPSLYYSLDNKSISLKNGDNQTPVDREDLIYLRNNILDVAQFYLKRGVDYIVNNISLFPEYNTNVAGDLHPQTKSYISSMYTPKGGGSCGGQTYIQSLGCCD